MRPGKVAVEQIPDKQITAQLLAEKMTCLLNNVRARAYELFERRGRGDGHDLDDWFEAEKELGALPTATIDETETGIRIRIECPEFSAGQLTVYAEPNAITVEGYARQTAEADDSQSSMTERTLFRRYELLLEIDTGFVTATLDEGVLEVIARKSEMAGEPPTPPTHKGKVAAA